MRSRDVVRMVRSFEIRAGSFEARGAPAAILAWAGVVAAYGVIRAVDRHAATLPEAFREAKGLLEAIRGDRRSPPLSGGREA